MHKYYWNGHLQGIEEMADFAFKKVFRQDFTQPGFVLIDFEKEIDSQSFRQTMVLLKNELSSLLQQRFQAELRYQWLGRFDQQETTKFHRDNAANQSFLMLGYEPSEVESLLFFADYSQFVAKKGLSEDDFFNNYNPIFHQNEQLLQPYTTEVQNFDKQHFKIVLMNNSALEGSQTFGVLHKAVVPQKQANATRIINSMMLYWSEENEESMISEAYEKEFIETHYISKR